MEGKDILLTAVRSDSYGDKSVPLSAADVRILSANPTIRNVPIARLENIKGRLQSAYRSDGDIRFKAMLYKPIEETKFNSFEKSLGAVFGKAHPANQDVALVEEVTEHLGSDFNVKYAVAIAGIFVLFYAIPALLKESSLVPKSLLQASVVLGIILMYFGGRAAYNEYRLYTDEPHWVLSKIF